MSFGCGVPCDFHKRGLFVVVSLPFVAWERLCYLIVALPVPFIKGVSS